MNIIKKWMRAATTAEQEALAAAAGTKRSYLYHLAGEKDKAYVREPQPKLAIALEKASVKLHKTSDGRLPLISRTQLVAACRQCEFAKQCLK